jgi:hypothetical protein
MAAATTTNPKITSDMATCRHANRVKSSQRRDLWPCNDQLSAPPSDRRPAALPSLRQAAARARRPAMNVNEVLL